MKLKIGDRVRMKTTSVWYSINASIDSDNPLCQGTIDGIKENMGVLWDNKQHNSYYEKDLELIYFNYIIY